MAQDWADKTAQQILSKDLFKKGICLILGASELDIQQTCLTAVKVRCLVIGDATADTAGL